MDNDYGNAGRAMRPARANDAGIPLGSVAITSTTENGGEERIALYRARAEGNLDIFTGKARAYVPDYLPDN